MKGKILYLEARYGENGFGVIIERLLRKNAPTWQVDIAVSVPNAMQMSGKCTYQLIVADATVDAAQDGAAFAEQKKTNGSVVLVIFDRKSDPEFNAATNIDAPWQRDKVVENLDAYIAGALEEAKRRNSALT